MRCSNAKLWLAAQRDGDLGEPQAAMLQNHLKHCPACRTYEQHLQSLHTLLSSPKSPPCSYASISTDRILRAVEQQKRISRQLEDIRTQQQFRMARLRGIVLPVAALSFFTLGSIPLLAFAL